MPFSSSVVSDDLNKLVSSVFSLVSYSLKARHLHHQWFKPLKMEKTLLKKMRQNFEMSQIYVFQPSVHQFLCSLNFI